MTARRRRRRDIMSPDPAMQPLPEHDPPSAGPRMEWDVARVEAFFEDLIAAPETPPGPVTAYHPAAAVLAAFDPEALRGIGGAPAPPPGDDLRRLLEDSVALPEKTGRARWSLRVGPREEALRTFATRADLRRALERNDRPGDDLLQRLFDGFILGPEPDLEGLDQEGLALAVQVIGWLTGVPALEPLELPDLDAIRRRLDLARLTSPLRRLGGEHFQNRVHELDAIRSHLAGPSWPPLVIWGVGGVGKSALVARAALELLDGRWFGGPGPVVYLDFDRKLLTPERPDTLLLEAVQQVAAQMPWASSAALVLAKELGGSVEDWSRGMRPSSVVSRQLSRFAGMLEEVSAWNDRPLLVILDTFEDVQYRSRKTVELLLNFLGQLQRQVHRARILIAGRSPLEAHSGPQIELKGLHLESAVSCLINLDVPADAARFIAERVGGNPLALHLAAEVVHRQSVQALVDEVAGEEFAALLRRGLAVGFLFRRILGQIHNPEVRKLAHPGLVLRWIDPELIREVLAGPCAIRVPDAASAQALWNELARETSLVVQEAGTILRHRADLRKEMLSLLRTTKPEQAAAIHEAAVRYFARRDDPESRAEELYHRLCLEQGAAELDPRWRPDAEPLLRGAVDELPPAGMAYLAARVQAASGGLEAVGVGADFWLEAELSVWERKTARWAHDLIRQDRLEEALQALRDRPERSPASPLPQLEARVLIKLGRWDEAYDMLAEALRLRPREAGPSLLALQSRVLLHLGRMEEARTALGEARGLAEADPRTPPGPRLDLAALDVRLAREPAERLAAGERLAGLVSGLPDRDLAAVPEEARHAAAELLGTHPEAAGRILRLVGPGPTAERAARAGKVAEGSAGLGGAGGLGAIGGFGWVGAPIQLQARAIPDAGDLADLGSLALDDRNSRTTDDRDPAEIHELVALLREDDEFVARRAAQAADAHARATKGADLEAIHRAFSGAFDYSELDWLVRRELGAPLDHITDHRALSKAVLDLIQWADARGDLTRLVEAAADVRPDFEALQEVHDRLRRPHPAEAAGAIRLGPTQEGGLVAALVEAFPDPGSFRALLRHRLEPFDPAGLEAADPADLVRATVVRANREGWAGPLIAAAREARPTHPTLYLFAEDCGLTATLPEDERNIREAWPDLDLNAWRARLGELEGQVCRVAVAGERGGTGLLIGPDLVLTVLHLLDPVLRGERAPADVSVTFDCKVLDNGQVWNTGLVCHLAGDWLVDRNPTGSEGRADPRALDYIVVRVAGAPGTRPVGWPRCEPDAPPRGWVEPASGAVEPAPSAPLVSLYYPGPGPLRLVVSPHAVTGTNPPWIQYRGLTGSSGAPVFDANLNPVALHHTRIPRPGAGEGPTVSPDGPPIARHGDEGVALAAIFASLLGRGICPVPGPGVVEGVSRSIGARS